MPIPVPRSIINRQWQSAHCYRGHQRPCGHTRCGIWCVVNGALPAVAVLAWVTTADLALRLGGKAVS